MVASPLLMCGLQFQALSLCVAHQAHAQMCSSCLAASEHLISPVNYDSTNNYGSCGAFKKHICSDLESLWDRCSCNGFCMPELEDYYQCSTAALTVGKMDCDEADLPCFPPTHGMHGRNNKNDEEPTSFSSVSQHHRQLQGPVESIFNSFVWFLNLFDIFNIIREPDSPPIAIDDVAFTKWNTSVVIDVLANDYDPDGDPLRISAIIKQPSNGVAEINGDGTDGTIIYTPDTSFSGIDTIKYEISSGPGGVCNPGWRGTNCDVDIDECAEDPSLCVDGTCTNTQGSFSCHDIDHCAEGICQNGGTCTNTPGSYLCTCAPGWEGENCDVDIDECSEDLDDCAPGESCTNTAGSFFCSCNGTFFVLDLRLDNKPSETSWEVIEDFDFEDYGNRRIIAQGGPYGYLPGGSEVLEIACIEGEGPFTFFIYDTFGDGICCDNGDGDYNITFGGVDFTPAYNFTYPDTDGFEQWVTLGSRRKASVQIKDVQRTPGTLPPKHQRALESQPDTAAGLATVIVGDCETVYGHLVDCFDENSCNADCRAGVRDLLRGEGDTCADQKSKTCSEMERHWEKCDNCQLCNLKFEKLYECQIMALTDDSCGSDFSNTCTSGECQVYKPDGTCVPCFSPYNTVEVKDKGAISITELQIGDLVSINEKGKYSRVYSFSHRDDKSRAEYLQIFVEGLPQPLEISPSHMLFVDNAKLVPASQVKEGDVLNSSGSRNKVSKITRIQRHGLYSPLTESGTIRVSGVDASNYVSAASTVPHTVAHLLDLVPYSVHHIVSHGWTAPLRWVCFLNSDICKEETYTNNGYSSWVYYANHKLFSKLGKAPGWLQIGLALLAAPVLVALHSPLLLVITLLVLLGRFWYYKKTAMGLTKLKIV